MIGSSGGAIAQDADSHDSSTEDDEPIGADPLPESGAEGAVDSADDRSQGDGTGRSEDETAAGSGLRSAIGRSATADSLEERDAPSRGPSPADGTSPPSSSRSGPVPEAEVPGADGRQSASAFGASDDQPNIALALAWTNLALRRTPGSGLGADALPATHPSGPRVLVAATPLLDRLGLRRRAVESRGDPAARRRQRTIGMLAWARNIGVIIVLFVAWQLAGTGLLEHHAQSRLKNEFLASVRQSGSRSPAGHGLQGTPSESKLLVGHPAGLTAPGSLVGRIQIPSIRLDQYVVEGTTESDLANGPGHYEGTAFPGYAGNVAIAGHRTTYGAPFNMLGSIRPGNLIYLTAPSGQRFTYVVRRPPLAVAPTDINVLRDFGDNRITLTTCTPEFSAAQRLVVTGVLTSRVKTVAGRGDRGGGLTASSSDASAWNFAALPVALLLTGLLVGLGLLVPTLRRRLSRAGLWVVLVPIWGAGLYLLFGQLSALLPPSL